MTVKVIFLYLLCVLLTACNKQPDILLFQQLNKKVISPDYQDLTSRAENINLTKNQCTSSQSEQVLEEMKDYWRSTMNAWQSVQWVKFGPITEDSREWQIQFWPDQKNIIGRKVNALLKAPELSSEQLEQAGIIAQGLPSLEYILFDEKVRQISTSEQQCLLGLLLAKEISSLTHSIYNDWLVYSQQQGQELAFAEDEVNKKRITILVVNSLVQQLDLIVDQKIAKPFSFEKKDARFNPYFLESWRSQHSNKNIKTNIAAIKNIFDQGGLKDYLLSAGHVQLAKDIQEKINSLEITIQSTKVFNFSGVVDGANAEKLKIDTLYRQLNELRRLIKNDLTKALNIRLSFNSSDGDS